MSVEIEKLNIQIQKLRNESVVTGIPVVEEISLSPKDWDIVTEQLKKRIFSITNTGSNLEPGTFKYNGMIVRRGEKEKETPEEEKPSE